MSTPPRGRTVRSRAVAVLVPVLVGLAVVVGATAFPRSLVVGGPVLGLRGVTNRPVGAERLPLRFTWTAHDRAILLTARPPNGCPYRVLRRHSDAPNRLEIDLRAEPGPCPHAPRVQHVLLAPPPVFGPADAVVVLVNGRGYRAR